MNHETLILAGTLAGLLISAVTIWRFARPHVKRAGAVADAILGEEEVRDRGGKVIVPARPGLVARVGVVEEALALLIRTNETLTNHETRITALEQHNERVVKVVADVNLPKPEGE